jgi:pimeloyl-ACP methyl ester carboxylesterase
MPSRVPSRRDDIEIYYEESGRGDPLLLIGGLTSSHLAWQLMVPELALEYRVITPDNRGSGRTVVRDDDGVRSTESFALDLLAFIDELALDRIHLMGVSMGGMIVQEFALRHPERLASLTIGCSTCGGERAISAPKEVIEALFLGAGEDSTADRATAAIDIQIHPESRAKRARNVEFHVDTKHTYPHSSEELLRRAAGIARHDTFERLAGLSVPTLVLTGSHDRLIPNENSALIAKQIPNAKLVEIGDAGHIFFVEQPEQTNRVLLDFLSEHPLTAAST